jgi:hypothetical protein
MDLGHDRVVPFRLVPAGCATKFIPCHNTPVTTQGGISTRLSFLHQGSEGREEFCFTPFVSAIRFPWQIFRFLLVAGTADGTMFKMPFYEKKRGEGG